MKTLPFAGRLLGCLLLIAGLASPAQADEPTGEIVEVKGPFFKITLAEPAALKVGAQGEIQTDDRTIPFLITSASDAYLVGRANGYEAQVGQKVRFAEPPIDFTRWVGKPLEVILSTGRQLDGVVLKEVATDEAGLPKALQVEMPDSGQSARLSLSTIAKISHAGETILEAANDPAADAAERNGDDKRPARRMSAKEEKQARWLELAKSNKISPWPAFTDEDREADIENEKKIAAELKKQIPNLALHETKYFLLFSTASENDLELISRYLDAMHVFVSKLYRVVPMKVFKGKLPVYIFSQKEEFLLHEQTVANNDATGFGGMCHWDKNRAYYTCYILKNPADFAHLLVNQTSFAELWAYKSHHNVPVWFRQGLADYIAMEVVPASQRTQKSRQEGIEAMQKSGSLNGLLDRSDRQDGDYGNSSLLVEYLIRQDNIKFVELLDLMKAGMKFDEAIQKSYGQTKEELITAFGRSIGFPDLRP
ncbi:hypothetical protein AB1L30_05530 [Bremerella sp. JC817]|uniref:hypothetical protein n=1 Tax=Bremerella sp. JC817 TaxID=3231756 RepID=UPI00345B11B9